jgi:hypothetical protein
MIGDKRDFGKIRRPRRDRRTGGVGDPVGRPYTMPFVVVRYRSVWAS